MWTFILFSTCTLFNPCLSENNVTLNEQPWPNAKNCEICVTVQYGKLEMRLPLTSIGKIIIVGSGDSVLHILPKANAPRDSILFLSVSPERLIKMYEKSGLLQGLGITTNEQFFDALGKLPGKNKSLAKIRHIENIDTAINFLKTSKESVHVYWIQSSIPGGSQKVYFVIDDEEIVYLLAGNVTQEFYEAVLTNLQLVDVP